MPSADKVEKRGGAGRGQGRHPLPADKKGKPVQCVASGVLLGMSGKQVKEAATLWVKQNGQSGIDSAPPAFKVGDSVCVRIETYDSFSHQSTRIMSEPLQRIDGVWVVAVQIRGKSGVVNVPVESVIKKN